MLTVLLRFLREFSFNWNQRAPFNQDFQVIYTPRDNCDGVCEDGG
jgi:hypothetical protein